MLRRLTALAIAGVAAQPEDAFSGQAQSGSTAGDRKRGLLIGGLLGDALGGPIEFSESPSRYDVTCNARGWMDDETLSDMRLAELASSLVLTDYESLRPEPAPYGQWLRNAPAGTVTDDSRHKIILVDALRAASQSGRRPTREDLARAFLDFAPEPDRFNTQVSTLCEEGLQEYRYAARWLLGERDLDVARPLERLWAGVNNCSGQMLLPPLAVCHAGQPEAAYRAAYELDFIDSPIARDIAAAVVAGLAAVLDPVLDSSNPSDRWQLLLGTMQRVDPFRYQDVPFAGRQLDRWMRLARDLAKQAGGSPKRLYSLLESEGRPVFWWDAHFTLLVPLSMLHLCDFHPLAALHLTLDFGHDTDSYAQLLCCMIGAVHGEQIFPEPMRAAVTKSVRNEYSVDLVEWMNVLNASASLPALKNGTGSR